MARDPSNLRRPSPLDLAEAFVTPVPHAARKRPDQPPGGTQVLVPSDVGRVTTWEWGEGPRVLLVHGWQADHGDMLSLIEPLLARSMSVVAMDLPAHGASTGAIATIPRLATAVRAVSDAIGPFRGVIAHSMGAAVSSVAVSRGLQVERLVLISAPARYEDQARAIADKFELTEREWLVMRQRLEELGTEFHQIDLPRLASKMAADALFIHSEDDKVVSIEDARETASVWPSASLIALNGLGHNRILSNADAIAAAVEFVTAPR